MKKTILGLIAIAFATFLFTSCEKDQLQDTFEQEVGNEYATVVLPSSSIPGGAKVSPAIITPFPL